MSTLIKIQIKIKIIQLTKLYLLL